ncbi:MmcQ/YjbR family DNA-binding protein [Kocuria sp.]|uniref:MmcQ/YjbR family DNA-binding protein n=1 Tax=Kocuria sp. TaxID=1871328 RepID=UPI003F8D4932
MSRCSAILGGDNVAESSGVGVVDGAQVQERAAARAEELPGSEMTHPFGPEWDVYKVRGKVFMLVTATTGKEMVNLKASPADSTSLRTMYPAEISPGYHMNKKHWITVTAGPNITPDLVDELVTESYLLVVEKLPKAQRPVDPATFGQSLAP